MVDALQILLAFPPERKQLSPKEYDATITSHVKEVSKLSTSAVTKSYDKKSLLELVDPAVNSVSYLFILHKHIESVQGDANRLDHLYPYIVEFLTSFDPTQVRYAAEEWRFVFEAAIQACANLQGKSPTLPDTTPLVNGLLRLDPTAGTFTSSHLFVVQVCLQLGVPSQALPLLDKNIYAFPQKSSKNVPEELRCEEQELSNTYITGHPGFSRPLKSDIVMEYFLLGGQIYTGLRRFSRARLFYETVLLTPSQHHATSILQAEAYKKWLLVGLLVDGKPWSAPKTMDQVVLKGVQATSRPYESIAECFEKRDFRKFQAELETAGPKAWQDDGNLRLINEVSQALDRFRIIDLQETYDALPLTRMAKLLEMQPQQTLQLIQNNIQNGLLNASIIDNGQDPEVRFHSSSSLAAPEQDLESQTKRIQELVTFLRDADRRLQLTKEYIEYQKRMKRTGGPEGDLADAMDLSWDATSALNPLQDGSDEEDIMA